MIEASSASKIEKDTTKEYYVDVDPAALIATFGKISPVHGGLPKSMPMELLSIAAKEHPFTMMYWYKSIGLCYTTPCVMGMKRKRARLTYSGLMLLDHWASKWPSFAPFVDAFVTNKARKIITTDSVDLKMGFLPERFKKDVARHEEINKYYTEYLSNAEAILRAQQNFKQKLAAKYALKQMRQQQTQHLMQVPQWQFNPQNNQLANLGLASNTSALPQVMLTSGGTSGNS